MPEIKPFPALRYNAKKVQLDEVVAPPYDVISEQQQDELYRRNPYNVIRLVLGREDNRYASAVSSLEEWKKQQLIISDSSPALYVLSQRYSLAGGETIDRYGFIAGCRLAEFGKAGVYAHEKTHSKPKEDRFQLFRATGAMFSQIFSIYSDPGKQIDRLLEQTMQGPALAEVMFEGIHNRLWRIDDLSSVVSIQQYLNQQNVFVADGHHRYETALAYSTLRRSQNPHHSGNEAYNFVPMFFTNMNNGGLVVLPTHRVLHDSIDFDAVKFIEKLQQYFHCASFESLALLSEALTKEKQCAFGVVLSGNSYSLLRVKNLHWYEGMGVPPILAQLDVTLLHALVFKHVLRISEDDQDSKRFLGYEKDAQQAVDLVQHGKAQAAFLLNPTRIDQVRTIAEAGLVMPQKSTYFYPKLLSGLVMYSFLDQR